MEYRMLEQLSIVDLRDQLEDMGIPLTSTMTKKDMLDAYLASLTYVQESKTITTRQRRLSPRSSE